MVGIGVSAGVYVFHVIYHSNLRFAPFGAWPLDCHLTLQLRRAQPPRRLSGILLFVVLFLDEQEKGRPGGGGGEARNGGEVGRKKANLGAGMGPNITTLQLRKVFLYPHYLNHIIGFGLDAVSLHFPFVIFHFHGLRGP